MAYGELHGALLGGLPGGHGMDVGRGAQKRKLTFCGRLLGLCRNAVQGGRHMAAQRG